MPTWQKWFVWQALVNFVLMVVYIQIAERRYQPFLHVPMMVTVFWMQIAVGLTIRDLYLRDFPHPNDKLTWCLLFFTGIGWIVYLCEYAMKPRGNGLTQTDASSPRPAAESSGPPPSEPGILPPGR
jgi:hypothetical protein